MNYSGVTPNDIVDWIDNYNIGNVSKYWKGKDDTIEAINKLNVLRHKTFVDCREIMEWFNDNLLMRGYDAMKPTETISMYRAFITVYFDEIFNLRISRHFSTEDATEKSMERYGEADEEFHLILERVPSTSPKSQINSDTCILDTPILVREISSGDFNDPTKRGNFIDIVIYHLKNPKGNFKENKQYKNMNNTRNKVRLTESQLHNVIKKCVNKILSEANYGYAYEYGGNGKHGGKKRKATRWDNAFRRWGDGPTGKKWDSEDGKYEYISDYEYADENGPIKGTRKTRKSLKENTNEGFYLAQVYELDGDNITDEQFNNLRDAAIWAKSQVEGPDAPYAGYAAEVFYVDEYGDYNETNYYYGNC